MVAEARFEVAFDVAPGTDPGTLDWTDLTSRIRVDTVDTTASQQSGSASLRLDNRDGDLDPLNAASPYNLVPMRHARITVDIGGAIHPVWRGYVDQWPPVWRFNDAVIDVELVDARVWLALQDADVDLPRQLPHERITTLLDLAGWPAELRDIDDGVVQLDAFEQASANLLRVIDDTADAEDGSLYVASDGKITFRSRHHRFDAASQLSVGGADIRVGSAKSTYGGDTLLNIGRVELANGDVFEAEDTASIGEYGPRDAPVRDLPVPEAEAVGIAQWLVYRFAQPTLALPTVALNIVNDAELADVLALHQGDLVTFTHSPPSGPVELVAHLASITHRPRAAVWRTALELAPYFGKGPWFEWVSDEAVEGNGWLSDEATEGGRWAP